jgi:hypothetical protein
MPDRTRNRQGPFLPHPRHRPKAACDWRSDSGPSPRPLVPTTVSAVIRIMPLTCDVFTFGADLGKRSLAGVLTTG